MFRDSQMYVFLIEAPLEEAATIETVIDSNNFVTKFIDGNLYRIYYKYYTTFEKAVQDLAEASGRIHENAIYPRHRLGTHYLRFQIGNRFGYLYDVNSAFEIMLSNKIENPAEV